MKTKQNIRYSEAFKHQVVEQIESGKFRNIAEANRAYGIKGAITVRRWLEAYGSGQCLPKLIKSFLKKR
jgi:transposase